MNDKITAEKDIVGRLAAAPWREGDWLPEVGTECLVSGANQDVESDHHRSFSWRRVIGYSIGNKFICLQTRDCWPTVERVENCWFADERLLLNAAAPDLLGALRDARTYLPGRPGCPQSLLERVDAAIAKAEGK